MKSKCDKCDKPATVHLTEIVGDQKTEKDLCEDCALAEGITVKTNMPIGQLLEEFVLQSPEDEEIAKLRCEVCGITFHEFRQQGLLGCPNDYNAFERALEPLLNRAQEGAARHIGKVPSRAGGDQKKQNALLKLRADLKNAIATEDYEKAADLRDQIKELEGS